MRQRLASFEGKSTKDFGYKEYNSSYKEWVK